MSNTVASVKKTLHGTSPVGYEGYKLLLQYTLCTGWLIKGGGGGKPQYFVNLNYSAARGAAGLSL